MRAGFTVAVSLLLVLDAAHAYSNSYDGYLNWGAGGDYFLNGAWSQHNNKKEDRVWNFYSARVPGWRGRGSQTYSSGYRAYINHNWAGRNQLVTSITGSHNNDKEDRSFLFQATNVHPEVAKVGSCRSMGTNSLDNVLSARCSSSEGIGGLVSSFSSNKKDRQFSFKCCQVDQYTQRYAWATTSTGDVHRCPRAVYNQPCHVSTLESRAANQTVTWVEQARRSDLTYTVKTAFSTADGSWAVTDVPDQPPSIDFTCSEQLQCEA